MKRIFITASFLISITATAVAQEIKVTPSSVNAYSQGATTVFLTFSGVVNLRPADACWCGDLISAEPDIGFKCNPANLFGCLPVRYDQSRLNASGIYTDIMTIPPGVARRAYIDAASGAEATFFYVRRFVSTAGGSDQFVPVTIRLSGNGAATPFSITDVKLSWGVDKPILIIKPDERLPSVRAEISYTGTGRLKGRWEIVKPGEDAPSERDLLTEATLPVEERGLQRRFTELSRFNIYLPPTGRFILAGPETWRVPNHIDGAYIILLRIEASEDARGGSIPATTGEPQAAISTGAVAGFPLPVLRYYVGGGSGLPANSPPLKRLTLISPAENSTIPPDGLADFRWTEIVEAAFYRIELEDSKGELILSAVLLQGTAGYRAPSWLKEKTGDGALRWRVVAFNNSSTQIAETPRRALRLSSQ